MRTAVWGLLLAPAIALGAPKKANVSADQVDDIHKRAPASGAVQNGAAAKPASAPAKAKATDKAAQQPAKQ